MAPCKGRWPPAACLTPSARHTLLRPCPWCFIHLAGKDPKTGVRVEGRVSTFNGTAWSIVRRGADNEDAVVTGVAPNRAWMVVSNSDTSIDDVWYYNSLKWDKKVRAG